MSQVHNDICQWKSQKCNNRCNNYSDFCDKHCDLVHTLCRNIYCLDLPTEDSYLCENHLKESKDDNKIVGRKQGVKIMQPINRRLFPNDEKFIPILHAKWIYQKNLS